MGRDPGDVRIELRSLEAESFDTSSRIELSFWWKRWCGRRGLYIGEENARESPTGEVKEGQCAVSRKPRWTDDNRKQLRSTKPEAEGTSRDT